MSEADHEPEPLHSEQLTWSVLLARWVDFARSARALPDDAAGRRVHDSVGDIIMLQAVWFALQHLDELDAAERALGLDRAELLIEKHAGQVEARFADAPMPTALRELIDEARAQLRVASSPADDSASGGSVGPPTSL